MATMGMRRLAQFCRRMGTALRAGVDVRTAWHTESQRGPMRDRERMAEVLQQVSHGHAVVDAMREAGGLFPQFTLEMVDVGERTGRLDEVLMRLADHYDHLLRLRRSFLQGIAWPLIELGVGIGIIGFLILILGVLTEGQMGVFGLSGVSGLLTYLLLVALVAGGLLLLGLAFTRGWFGTAPMALFIRLPVVGTSVRTMALSRLAWTLAMALNSGIDARRSMRLALRSTHNVYFTSHADQIDQVLVRGGQFHESLAVTGAFPDEFVDAIEAAELTGTHTESLERLSDEYRQRSESAMQALTAFATVAITLGVLAVGGAVIIYMVYALYITPINDALREL